MAMLSYKLILYDVCLTSTMEKRKVIKNDDHCPPVVTISPNTTIQHILKQLNFVCISAVPSSLFLLHVNVCFMAAYFDTRPQDNNC